ncbi:MAG: hypothetical protein HQ517_01740, partial [SAR324 cluster bacterium]|nr:hypothetical protein [SAR324 cluster bacterium]
INYTKVFLPIEAGQEIIDMVYYNLEQILHHNFITYDETGDRYLAINETLIFKDLEATLKRSKSKELTRNKILNNLQFNTIEKREIAPELEMLSGDKLHDLLNQIQDTKLQKATEQSREMYGSYLQEAVHSLGELSTEKVPGKEDGTHGDAVDEVEQTKPVGGSWKGSSQHAVHMSQRRENVLQGRVQVPQPPDENRRVPSPGQSDNTLSPERVKV